MFRSIYIDYVMIPEIDIYMVSNKTSQKAIYLGTTRDRKNLSNDITHGYTIDWPFKMGEVVDCYIRFNGKGWSVQPIISMFDSQNLLADSFNRTYYVSAFRLTVFIIFVVVVCLYLLSRIESFIYYALMMMGAILYVETELGGYHKIFNIDHFYLSYILRNAWNVVYYFFLFTFIKSNLEEGDEDWLMGKKIVRYIIYLQIAMFVSVAIFHQFSEFIPSFISLASVMITTLVLTYLVVFLVYKSIKGNIRAKFFLAIYFVSINVVLLVVAAPHVGLVRRLPDQYNIISVIFFFEFMIFLVITIVDAWKMILERNKLLEENKQKERSLAFALISGQESERNRIGRELHDAIGGNLASAKHKIHDSGYVDKVLSETLYLVRDMSHGLVIPSINSLTFKDNINDLAMKFSNEQMKVYTTFHNWPDSMDDDRLGHLYRIAQELLQNASKHSRATKVFVQFLGGDSCQMSYEDNGVGFDLNSESDGLGFKNINFRVQALFAKLSIESSPMAGTTIQISEIPFD